MSIFLLIFIYSKIVLCRNINKDSFLQLSEYKPSFLKEEIKPSTNSFYISMEYLPNFHHQISYKVFLAEINNDAFYSDEFIFDDFKHTKEEIELYIKNNDSLWNDWSLYYKGDNRILKIDSSNKNSKFRVKYQIISKYSTSKESDIKIITLQHKNNKVNIYIKGTGRNNHENAEVFLNSINIFKHGKYQGLACILLNRKDLSVDEVKFFDTFNKKITSTHINEDFINYSYDEEGNVIKTTSKKEISKDNILSASQEFEKFLKIQK